jgi:hypothetical protein
MSRARRRDQARRARIVTRWRNWRRKRKRRRGLSTAFALNRGAGDFCNRPSTRGNDTVLETASRARQRLFRGCARSGDRNRWGYEGDTCLERWVAMRDPSTVLAFDPTRLPTGGSAEGSEVHSDFMPCAHKSVNEPTPTRRWFSFRCGPSRIIAGRRIMSLYARGDKGRARLQASRTWRR